MTMTMTNLELRILSGLHRGAALPLDSTALELGAGEESGVVLADRGLARRHARLAPGMTGWRLEALDGDVYDAFAGSAQPAVDCPPGACARLGQVWLCVSPAEAAWQAAPEPAPVLPDTPPPAPAAAQAAAPSRPAAARAPSRRRRLVLLPFGLVIVLCAATAYAFTARPAGLAPPNAAAGVAMREAPALDPGAAADARAAAARPLSPRALRAAFERELANAQMLERFELTLEDERWRMRADLGEEEKERFERMLARFVAAHGIAFPVDARIVPSVALLPFRIEQVLSGAQAGIVTDGGQRLFVGDEYRGTRLVSMQDGRLVFAGKRRIEVQW